MSSRVIGPQGYVHDRAHDDRADPADGTGTSRRGFLGSAGLAALGAAGGAAAPFVPDMPWTRPAFAQGSAPASSAAAPSGPQPLSFPGKDKLSVLGDRPLVAETPAELLDDDTTPISKFFIRNNGVPPEPAKEPDSWKIRIDGEVGKPREFTLAEIKQQFKARTYRMVLECGGNGRSQFSPQARGNQWTTGGVGCAEWTGVALADLLKAVGVKPTARYSSHYGADIHLSGDANRTVLSRGVRIEKALDPSTIVAWAMNGEPLPPIHGGPVRLIVPGWPASCSQKWLTRITMLTKEHDGPGMLEFAYRLPIKPMIPGDKGDPANFRILESMPVRSIITSPANGTKLPAGTRTINLRGASWAGDFRVKRVDVSIDSGQSWQATKLAKPRNAYDWQRWTAAVKLPSDGYFEIWARATDSRGIMQPPVAANWNPQGYGANAMHRIAVLVG
jgi:DMSO/TMAO reductase YedYZ molybdopterin-dependent catalytic subunit